MCTSIAQIPHVLYSYNSLKQKKTLAIAALTPNTVSVTPGYASLSPDTDTFTVFASVNKITRATLKVMCDQCKKKNVFKTVHERSYLCCYCSKNTSGCVEALVAVEIDDGRRPCLVLLEGIQQFAVLLKLKKKDSTKLCGIVISQCKMQCHQTEGLDPNYDFNYMIIEANFAHAYKFTYRK